MREVRHLCWLEVIALKTSLDKALAQVRKHVSHLRENINRAKECVMWW